jgi:hypothetical protein
VVGSIGEVGEHLRARVMLRVGWMGLEEHQRHWSMVAKEWRRWQARVEWRELDGVIASGSRGAAASRRQGGGDEGVEASGEGGVVWRRSVAAAGRRETTSPMDRQRDSDARGGDCMRDTWSKRGNVEPAAGGQPTARW